MPRTVQVHISVYISRLLHLCKLFHIPPSKRMIPLRVLLHGNRGSVVQSRPVRTPLFRSSHKNIPVPPVVKTIDRNCPQHLRRMRQMVRRSPVRNRIMIGKPAAEVMDISAPLGRIVKCIWRCKNIVIHQIRAMGYFHHQIPVIFVIDIAAHPGSLSLPVKPGSQCAVMDVIVMNLHIDGRVKLDPGDFMAVKLMFYRNIINLIPINLTEHTAQMAHDSVLPAVVNDIAPNDMGTDPLLSPSYIPGPEHRFHLILVARLSMVFRKFIIARASLFADADTAAFGIVDIIIFDDPALTPVRPQQPLLHGGGRRPGCGGMHHLKSPDCDVIQPCFLREKAGFPYIDFHLFLIWIRSLEIGIDRGGLPVCLTVPLV